MGVAPLTKGRALFLDRDGVIVRAIVRDGKPYPPSCLTEMEILPGAAAALRKAKERGFVTVVVTNQPDVARGRQSQSLIESMHQHLRSQMPIDDIFVCYHDDADQCLCRKPKPGMLYAAAEKHHLDLAASILVGDRWRDIDAGAAGGCRTILIDYNYRERGPAAIPDLRVSSLAQAIDSLDAL